MMLRLWLVSSGSSNYPCGTHRLHTTPRQRYQQGLLHEDTLAGFQLLLQQLYLRHLAAAHEARASGHQQQLLHELRKLRWQRRPSKLRQRHQQRLRQKLRLLH